MLTYIITYHILSTASKSDSSSNTEDEKDIDDLEALGLTPFMEAIWTDLIVKVMSLRATDADEVADFTLPSRSQPIEIRSSQGGSACFVACHDNSKIKYSTNKQINLRDGYKKLHFRFPNLEVLNACVDGIERCIANTKTPYGHPNPVEADVMNAVIDMLGSHPAVVAHQVAHPLDELGYMMKLLNKISKVDGCGGMIGERKQSRYTIPCMCGHDECNKDVWYKTGPSPSDQFGLMHQSCALRYMNVRSDKSGYMIFDYPALNIEGELVNSDIGRLFFVTYAGASCPNYSNPTSYAQLIPFLHGTAIATALVESSTEKREARASYLMQRYHSNLQDHREYYSTRAREAAAAKRALSWQHYVEMTGDTTSMSEAQVNQRCREIDQAVTKFKQEHEDRNPFIQVCDAKEVEKNGQMIIANKEESAFTQRSGAPFKRDDGENFSRSQIGPFGSGADIEMEIGIKWELPSGRVSRDNETALILYCKKKYPGNTLNQREVAQDTDIMANRKGWDNSNRINLLMLVDLLPALTNGTAKLTPDPVGHMADVQRLKNRHPSRFFL